MEVLVLSLFDEHYFREQSSTYYFYDLHEKGTVPEAIAAIV